MARPKQALKNVLVLAAPGAAGVLTHGDALLRAGGAFLVFSAVATGTYFLNDVADAEADRRHPVKMHRPVAAGVISPAMAVAVGTVLVLAGVGASAALGWRLVVVTAVYVGVQAAYTLRLKHEAVFDLACVASGFVLRAIAGGVAVGVPISQWFLIVATFGSMMMVTGKRLAEHRELGDERGAHRRSLDQYSEDFLRVVSAVSAAVCLTAYCLWALERPTQLLHPAADPIFFQLSIVPFVLAILRYGFMVESGHGSRPEEVVVSDRLLQLMGVAWLVSFALGVYAS
jgi:decaprenyl-phosphate phosphoribosyltransferase